MLRTPSKNAYFGPSLHDLPYASRYSQVAREAFLLEKLRAGLLPPPHTAPSSNRSQQAHLHALASNLRPSQARRALPAPSSNFLSGATPPQDSSNQIRPSTAPASVRSGRSPTFLSGSRSGGVAPHRSLSLAPSLGSPAGAGSPLVSPGGGGGVGARTSAPAVVAVIVSSLKTEVRRPTINVSQLRTSVGHLSADRAIYFRPGLGCDGGGLTSAETATHFASGLRTVRGGGASCTGTILILSLFLSK